MKKEQKVDSWSSGDPAHKKLLAYGIVAVFVGVMAVLGVRSVSGPQLYKGDRQEVMTCRLCQGSSKQCKLCLATGKVKVIVPGPNHPLDLRGTIRDASAFPSAEHAQATADREAGEVSLKPVTGAVPNARLTFTKDGKSVPIQGKATGRFRCNLPPGNYQLSVEAEGYQPLKQSFEIPARKLPVWPARPGLDLDDERLKPLFLLRR